MTGNRRLNELEKELNKRRASYNKDIEPLRQERNKIEEDMEKKESQKYVGKYFRYMNGCGGEHWPIYYMVTGIGEYKDVICLRIEEHPKGVISMTKGHSMPREMLEREISESVFGKI